MLLSVFSVFVLLAIAGRSLLLVCICSPGRVPTDAETQTLPTTSLVTANVHSRPILMNKCILEVNLGQQSPAPEERKRAKTALFIANHIFTKELLHWV